MYEKLKALIFYNPNDEAGRLFSCTCDLAYQMHGFGDNEKAELLYSWAKEQAEYSKEWCEREDYPLDDYIHGI